MQQEQKQHAVALSMYKKKLFKFPLQKEKSC